MPKRKHKGSGWGNFKKGKKANMKNIRKGSILLNDSKQFRAKNVLKVTSVDKKRGLIRGHYVNPKNTRQRRNPGDRTIAVWDFALDDYSKVRRK